MDDDLLLRAREVQHEFSVYANTAATKEQRDTAHGRCELIRDLADRLEEREGWRDGEQHMVHVCLDDLESADPPFGFSEQRMAIFVSTVRRLLPAPPTNLHNLQTAPGNLIPNSLEDMD